MQACKDEERVQKRIDMQAKLQGANDRRQSHLNELRRKAQEEERKVSEIHLINQVDFNGDFMYNRNRFFAPKCTRN